MSDGLLNKMLLASKDGPQLKPDPEDMKGAAEPEEYDETHEDMIVFMRDFDNKELSASQRLAALVDLIKMASK